MKFNEKLIELRKKRGLSQEELGYKFNVTRQTISKWELGQTTPEMDKLIEISKFFNVTVDDLINDTEEIHNDTINNDNTNNVVIEDKVVNDTGTKKRRTIIVVIIVVAIVLLLGTAVVSPVFKVTNNIFDEVTGTMQEVDKQQEGIWAIFNKIFGLIDEHIEETKETDKRHEVNRFNIGLSFHQGTNDYNTTKELIDEVVTKNKTEERKVAIVFNGQKLTKTEDMIDIKKQIVASSEYEIDFQYDEEGYIYQMDIESIEKNSSNNKVSEKINKIEQDMQNINPNPEELFNKVFNDM